MNNALIIEGGHPLRGNIQIGGSKNAVLPCLAGLLVSSEKSTLRNVPLIGDLYTMLQIIESLGVKTQIDKGAHALSLVPSSLKSKISKEYSGLLRGSVFLLAPILVRNGVVKIEDYGGCNIGARPIDFHLHAFRSMGAKIDTNEKYVEITAQKLVGAKIEFPFPSVGATENAIIAACLANGESIINNAAVEPEVLDLIHMLQSMGAQIEYDTEIRHIQIKGRQDLGGTNYSIIADRIEAGTYAVAAAITSSDITLNNVNNNHLQTVIGTLNEVGVSTNSDKLETLHVLGENQETKKINIHTNPYPGFPTDLQPQFASLATKCIGESRIHENIYENRFEYVNELRKMGANIDVFTKSITVKGPVQLKGNDVVAPDLRGGAALILAALVAKGITHIQGIDHVNRGYEKIDEKLRSVGARIETE